MQNPNKNEPRPFTSILTIDSDRTAGVLICYAAAVRTQAKACFLEQHPA